MTRTDSNEATPRGLRMAFWTSCLIIGLPIMAGAALYFVDLSRGGDEFRPVRWVLIGVPAAAFVVHRAVTRRLERRGSGVSGRLG